MITCDFYIAMVEHLDDPDAHRGLSVGVEPKPENCDRGENMAWHFFNLGIQCALQRIKAQMVNNTITSSHFQADVTGREEFNRRVDEVAGRRLAGSISVMSNGPGLLYFAIIAQGEKHPLEIGAWETMKAAMDYVFDFLGKDFGEWSYETAMQELGEDLEELLAKQPVFPRIEPKRK